MSSWKHWRLVQHVGARRLAIVVAASVFMCGVWWHNAALLGTGAALLCFLLRRAADGEQANDTAHNSSASHQATKSVNKTAPPSKPPVSVRTQSGGPPTNTDALVDDLLTTGRYALLLRPDTKRHLSQSHIARAVCTLDEAMALVPGGRVLLGQLAEQMTSMCGASDIEPKSAQRSLVGIEPAYLDRLCVTNKEYQRFVDAGGYEQLEFWHEEALPALLDFVDRTAVPGPRYWSDGRYAEGEDRLPVAGVSWYEACAYACWVGKRLPTEAEWTKAGAWPVESAPGRIVQRRYPWGDSFDARRAHLFGPNSCGPVAVDEYSDGMTVGGVQQLIGNVWEWTASPLCEVGDPSLHVSESVISIRGGAFDTYFENHATCHYQSGEHRLSRRPNIGFRLALAMSDLEAATDHPTQNVQPTPATQQSAPAPAATVLTAT